MRIEFENTYALPLSPQKSKTFYFNILLYDGLVETFEIKFDNSYSKNSRQYKYLKSIAQYDGRLELALQNWNRMLLLDLFKGQTKF